MCNILGKVLQVLVPGKHKRKMQWWRKFDLYTCKYQTGWPKCLHLIRFYPTAARIFSYSSKFTKLKFLPPMSFKISCRLSKWVFPMELNYTHHFIDCATLKLSILTCREVHEESSTGSSWREFFDRSSFMSSLHSQTSDGTALSPCPSRESSLKQEKHELMIKQKITE